MRIRNANTTAKPKIGRDGYRAHTDNGTATSLRFLVGGGGGSMLVKVTSTTR
jgi:hypothetical protein